LVFETEKMFKEKKDKYYYSAANHIDSTTPYHAWRGIFATMLDKVKTNNLPYFNTIQEKKIPDNILEQIDIELLPLLNSVLVLNLADTPRILQMSAQVRSETTQALLTRILTLIIPSCSLISLINAQWYEQMSFPVTLF
jgi:hypothetical protein